MPKIRYPVLVRAQKLAVMRVRNVIYTSVPYPVRVGDRDEDFTATGSLYSIDIKRLLSRYGENESFTASGAMAGIFIKTLVKLQ